MAALQGQKADGGSRDATGIPWYPDWTKQATCAKELTVEQAEVIFFETRNNRRKQEIAKGYCNRCPVVTECLDANMEVPYGIFGGMTPLERWKALHKKGYPNKADAYRYFAQFYSIFDDKSARVARRPSKTLPTQ